MSLLHDAPAYRRQQAAPTHGERIALLQDAVAFLQANDRPYAALVLGAVLQSEAAKPHRAEALRGAP